MQRGSDPRSDTSRQARGDTRPRLLPGTVACGCLRRAGVARRRIRVREPGSGESHLVALRLAESGRRVRTVDYRLAPRLPWSRSSTVNHYPAGLDDVGDAGCALAAECGAIVVGGASAGACLAVTAAQRLPGVGGRN
ncbi:alpha/beta hydrolase [Nocardia beijingensis]|uniref:alpha/beta hydrolase n=1 Tax=Nocardia beijingensis TaxID=95162 RepID=UPI00340F9ACE